MSGDPRLSSWRRKRLRLAVKDAGRVNGMWCCSCGRRLDPDGPWDLDEITPRIFGGDPEDPAQVRPRCRQCNRAHGARITNAIKRAKRRPGHVPTLIINDW